VIKNKGTYPTLRDIYEAHGWKKDYEKNLPLSRFIFRPVGFLLTWVAIRLGFTTEGIAWLSGIVGITGCSFLMLGGQYLLPLGIGLLLLFNLLDCVDGSIARTMKTANPYGIFLDSICGGMIDLAFWGVIGIMAFRNNNLLLWTNPYEYNSFFWLAIGSTTCFLNIFLSFLERTFDSTLRDYWEKILISNSNRTDNVSASEQIHPTQNINIASKRRYFLRMINNNLRVRENHYFFLIISYLTHTIDLLLTIYLFYYLAQIIILLLVFSKRGNKIRHYYLKDT